MARGLILQDIDISLNGQLRHYGNVKRTDKTMGYKQDCRNRPMHIKIPE